MHQGRNACISHINASLLLQDLVRNSERVQSLRVNADFRTRSCTYAVGQSRQVGGCRCMLLAERVLQGIELGHTDIRWENIIQVRSEFVLIDLEFASKLGLVPFTPLGTLSAC